MQKNYSYPIDSQWTTEEITKVIHLWTSLEQAYEGSISVKEMTLAYASFKSIVPSKAEEKRLSREFEQLTGYSLYRTMKAIQDLNENEKIHMNEEVRKK